MDCLHQLPEVASQPRFIMFLTKTVKAGTLAAKFARVQAERTQATSPP